MRVYKKREKGQCGVNTGKKVVAGLRFRNAYTHTRTLYCFVLQVLFSPNGTSYLLIPAVTGRSIKGPELEYNGFEEIKKKLKK